MPPLAFVSPSVFLPFSPHLPFFLSLCLTKQGLDFGQSIHINSIATFLTRSSRSFHYTMLLVALTNYQPTAISVGLIHLNLFCRNCGSTSIAFYPTLLPGQACMYMFISFCTFYIFFTFLHFIIYPFSYLFIFCVDFCVLYANKLFQ